MKSRALAISATAYALHSILIGSGQLLLDLCGREKKKIKFKIVVM
jgi:hypothetical protein